MSGGWGIFWANLRRSWADAHRRAARGTALLVCAAFIIGNVISWGQAVYGQGGKDQPAGKAATAAKAAAPKDDSLSGLPEMEVKIGGKPGDSASLIQIMLLFTLLTLAPSIVIMVTPFTRIIIVLSLLRNAMGTQQAPPNNVLVGLALFLSFFVMQPVMEKINNDALKPLANETITADVALERAQVPLRAWMNEQTRPKDLALFVDMARMDQNQLPENYPMHVVIPAFMISELKTAFQIGFVIYLPFLVIDMVVSAILMSMGMMMLPPVLISLPFKLLMFVLSDGWNLIFGSLVRSFKPAVL